jgi:hypothetical protein
MNLNTANRAKNARMQYANNGPSTTPGTFSTSRDFIFNGNREQYFQFETQLAHKLEQQGSNYILDETEVQRRSTPPTPPAFIPPVPDETRIQLEERRFRSHQLNQKYSEDLKNYNKFKDEMSKDFNKAIAVIKLIVTQTISNEIDILKDDHVYLSSDPLTRFSLIMDLMRREHGPNGEETARILKEKLAKLNGEGPNGFKNMVLQYKRIVSHLTRNLRLDGNGDPIAAGSLTDRTYRPSDEELKGYIKEALKNTSKAPFYNIYIKVITPPNNNMTPDQIIDEIQNLITNKVEERLPNNSNSNNINNNNFNNNNNRNNNYNNRNNNYRGNMFPNILPQNRNNNMNQSRSYSATDYFDFEGDDNNNINIDHDNPSSSSNDLQSYSNISNIQDSINDNNDYTCVNCHSDDHTVANCTARFCGHCGKFFNSLQDRKNHYIKEHYNKRKDMTPSPSNSSYVQPNKRINNNNNNNNKNNNKKNYNANKNRFSQVNQQQPMITRSRTAQSSSIEEEHQDTEQQNEQDNQQLDAPDYSYDQDDYEYDNNFNNF